MKAALIDPRDVKWERRDPTAAPPGAASAGRGYHQEMGNRDDVRPQGESDAAPEKEPPYQALFPNLDRVSSSSFRRGTVSRRRINRALAVIAVIPVVVLAVIFLPQLFSR